MLLESGGKVLGAQLVEASGRIHTRYNLQVVDRPSIRLVPVGKYAASTKYIPETKVPVPPVCTYSSYHYQYRRTIFTARLDIRRIVITNNHSIT